MSAAMMANSNQSFALSFFIANSPTSFAASSFTFPTKRMMNGAQKLRNIACQLIELAETESTFVDATDSRLIYRAAKREYDARRKRIEHFPAHYFGEPAWDMMLDLLIHHETKRTVTIGDACLASAAPNTTALRWQSKLEQDNLISRKPSRRDGRTVTLSLTSKGLSAMRGCLLSGK